MSYFVTPWTVTHQAPSVHGISQARILEWITISPGDLLNPGIKPTFPALAGGFLTTELFGKPSHLSTTTQIPGHPHPSLLLYCLAISSLQIESRLLSTTNVCLPLPQAHVKTLSRRVHDLSIGHGYFLGQPFWERELPTFLPLCLQH